MAIIQQSEIGLDRSKIKDGYVYSYKSGAICEFCSHLTAWRARLVQLITHAMTWKV